MDYRTIVTDIHTLPCRRAPPTRQAGRQSEAANGSWAGSWHYAQGSVCLLVGLCVASLLHDGLFGETTWPTRVLAGIDLVECPSCVPNRFGRRSAAVDFVAAGPRSAVRPAHAH